MRRIDMRAMRIDMGRPSRKALMRGARVGDMWSTTLEKMRIGLPRQGAEGALD